MSAPANATTAQRVRRCPVCFGTGVVYVTTTAAKPVPVLGVPRIKGHRSVSPAVPLADVLEADDERRPVPVCRACQNGAHHECWGCGCPCNRDDDEDEE